MSTPPPLAAHRFQNATPILLYPKRTNKCFADVLKELNSLSISERTSEVHTGEIRHIPKEQDIYLSMSGNVTRDSSQIYETMRPQHGPPRVTQQTIWNRPSDNIHEYGGRFCNDCGKRRKIDQTVGTGLQDSHTVRQPVAPDAAIRRRNNQGSLRRTRDYYYEAPHLTIVPPPAPFNIGQNPVEPYFHRAMNENASASNKDFETASNSSIIDDLTLKMAQLMDTIDQQNKRIEQMFDANSCVMRKGKSLTVKEKRSSKRFPEQQNTYRSLDGLEIDMPVVPQNETNKKMLHKKLKRKLFLSCV